MIIYGIDFGGGNCSDKCCRDGLSNKCPLSNHIPVQLLPNLGDADRDHIYITPDNVAWIPNYDGTGWIQLPTGGQNPSGEQTPPLGEQPTTDGDTNVVDKTFDRLIINMNHILFNSEEQKFYVSDNKYTYDIPNTKSHLLGTLTSHENLGEALYGIKKVSDNEFLFYLIPSESREVLWTKHTKEHFFSTYRYDTSNNSILYTLFDSDEGTNIHYNTSDAMYGIQGLYDAINQKYPIDIPYMTFNDDEGTVDVMTMLSVPIKLRFS